MRTGIILIPLPWSKPPLTGNRTRGNPYAQATKVKVALLVLGGYGIAYCKGVRA